MKISVRMDLYVTNNDRMRHATMALGPRVTTRGEFDDKGEGQISAIVTGKSLASTEEESKRRAMAAVLDDMLSSFTSVYLTIISIIQGSIFSYATIIIYQNHSRLELSQWVLVGVTGLFYVAVWQEYMYMSVLFNWVPGVKDAILPFALGAAELVLVSSILYGAMEWIKAMTATLLIGVLILANTNWRLYKDRELNVTQWAILREFQWWRGPMGALTAASLQLVCATVLVIFSSQLSKTASGRNLLAVIAALVAVAYFFRLILYVPNFRRIWTESQPRQQD
jgi:hypothetical protein